MRLLFGNFFGNWYSIAPELALALFVAPILLDAAYDSRSEIPGQLGAGNQLGHIRGRIHDCRCCLVAHALIPTLPWPAAIALGAVVAPPDAIAATAVLRQLRPPYRILTILEGESLLNDAGALLIYCLAIGAAANDSRSSMSLAARLIA